MKQHNYKQERKKEKESDSDNCNEERGCVLYLLFNFSLFHFYFFFIIIIWFGVYCCASIPKHYTLNRLKINHLWIGVLFKDLSPVN